MTIVSSQRGLISSHGLRKALEKEKRSNLDNKEVAVESRMSQIRIIK